jgi:ABC-2 type transport system ATP-binding protein
MDRKLVVQRAEELVDVLGIEEAAGQMVVDYSHGMTTRVIPAAAMLHAPRVLFLDEQFEAIDPVSTLAMESLLRRHVAFVEHGRIKAESSMDEVRGTRRFSERCARRVGGPEPRCCCPCCRSRSCCRGS